MNPEQFICLLHKKLITDLTEKDLKSSKCFKSNCVSSGLVCSFLRLDSVSLGRYGDVVCKEHIIAGSGHSTKKECNEHVKELLNAAKKDESHR